MVENWSTLIDFSKIPNEMISGLSGESIEKLAKRSMGVQNEADDELNFKDIDENVMKQIHELESSSKAKNTEAQTKFYFF